MKYKHQLMTLKQAIRKMMHVTTLANR